MGVKANIDALYCVLVVGTVNRVSRGNVSYLIVVVLLTYYIMRDERINNTCNKYLTICLKFNLISIVINASITCDFTHIVSGLEHNFLFSILLMRSSKCA